MDEQPTDFLLIFEQAFHKLQNYNRISSSGLTRKMHRLLFHPGTVLNFILWRYELEPKLRKTKLFWGKKVDLSLKDYKDFEAFGLKEFGFLTNESEVRLTKFFIRNLKSSDVFYDVGANYGFYTYLALELCKEVHSFEPLPEAFINLNGNLKDIPNIFLNNLAVAEHDGVAHLYMPANNSSGTSTIVSERLKSHQESFDTEKPLEVKTINLDSYLLKHSHPTIIKLDVEGAEAEIIDGGLDFFRTENPIVSLEVWGYEESPELSRKAVEKLRSLGYRSHRINMDGGLEEAEGDLSAITQGFDNFIFKKG